MAQHVHAEEAAEIQLETKRLKRGLTLLPLTGIIYFTVCGGTFGIEPLIGGSGPGLALLLILLTPLIFSVPLILMVREMNSWRAATTTGSSRRSGRSPASSPGG
jgi:hypothetical protein